MFKTPTFFAFIFLIFSFPTSGQEAFTFKPIAGLQSWASFTTGTKVFNPDNNEYIQADNQLNFYIRRTRLGIKIQNGDRLSFKIVGAFDNIGRNPLTGPVAGTNSGAFPSFGLWDTYFDWKLSKKSDALHLIAGYYTPVISRESVTSAFNVSSMEKSMSQAYIRGHITNTGPGRTTGLTLAGIFFDANRKHGFKYAIGLHSSAYTPERLSTLNGGAGPLGTARIVWYAGDLEGQKFEMGEPIFNLSKTKLLTVGASGSFQGKTYLFNSSWTGGVDLHAQWQQFSIESEVYFLGRESNDNNTQISNVSQTGFLRFTMHSPLFEKYILEPSIMWMVFRGSMDMDEQIEAAGLGVSSGSEDTIDVGLNCYLNNRKLKVYLHYNHRLGDSGAIGDGADINMYFFQPGVGPIQRGNWLGAGVNVVI